MAINVDRYDATTLTPRAAVGYPLQLSGREKTRWARDIPQKSFPDALMYKSRTTGQLSETNRLRPALSPVAGFGTRGAVFVVFPVDPGGVLWTRHW